MAKVIRKEQCPTHLKSVSYSYRYLRCRCNTCVCVINSYTKAHRESNREYHKKRKKEWYNSEAGTKYRKKRNLLKFGLSLEEYHELLRTQNSLCAVCNKEESMSRNGKVCSLAVDHDHESGKVRGLLCSRCNKGLGCFLDSVEFLRSAIKYLGGIDVWQK